MTVVGFTDAIKIATSDAMERDPRVHMIGLGVNYPNGADGTTGGLAERFSARVWDTPCSENAITGAAVGMAISGLRPIVHHGRIEFALYAADQIITQAAKWNYMFGGDFPCPLTVRVALGRQWGNGPQHTQIGRAVFATPGLKVVVPSTPGNAYGLLLAAVADNNPVIYMEHRWLYKLQGLIPPAPISLGNAQVLTEGKDITIVAIGDMVVEALRAAIYLREHGVSAEVIDLVSLYPMDKTTLCTSVCKTGKLVVCDTAPPAFSAAREVIALITEELGNSVIRSQRVTCPETPCPTATSLTAEYYPTDIDVVRAVASVLDIAVRFPDEKTFEELHLPPKWNVSSMLDDLNQEKRSATA